MADLTTDQEKLMKAVMPYMAEAVRIHQMNPHEHLVKRPEDFHQNYKYIDNYYQSKHTWNSQKCKTCCVEKKFEEFKMVEMKNELTIVYVNCNSCIERQKELMKEMGFFGKGIIQMMGFLFRLKEKNLDLESRLK